jgi:hypothetical protein
MVQIAVWSNSRRFEMHEKELQETPSLWQQPIDLSEKITNSLRFCFKSAEFMFVAPRNIASPS